MTLYTVQGYHDTAGQIYMTFSVTSARHGNPTVYWGTQAFAIGSNIVYPVVLSFGSIRSVMSTDGTARDASITMDLSPSAEFVPSNGTTLWTVADFLRELNIKDVSVGIWQYNAYDPANQTQIWGGQVAGIEGYTLTSRVGAKISLRLTSQEKGPAHDQPGRAGQL